MFKLSCICIACALLSSSSGFGQDPEKKVMLFYKTASFHHNSIDAAKKTIQTLGEKNDFEVISTKDAKDFLSEDLSTYDLVIFANTSGNVFNTQEQRAFQNYIEQGGSFFGIHAAADTEVDWPFFLDLVGGYFLDHPEIQEANVLVNKPEHPSVAHLPEVWTITDEWYNYKNLRPDLQVLLYLDESSYEGGKNGDQHPIAWFQETGYGGISIYTGLGHASKSYEQDDFKEHLLQSILFGIEGHKK